MGRGKIFQDDWTTDVNDNGEPRPDIAVCVCGWRGSVKDCEKAQEGNWEHGYYIIHLCPRCEDGGDIIDYDMTPQREQEWWKWHNAQGEE
ncbi:hypothetical protein GF374_03405 [Candidatus Woesearchaeota archaeon]|nr:hypothetical protein [Candidatus Woesearchaeota archaeon]